MIEVLAEAAEVMAEEESVAAGDVAMEAGEGMPIDESYGDSVFDDTFFDKGEIVAQDRETGEGIPIDEFYGDLVFDRTFFDEEEIADYGQEIEPGEADEVLRADRVSDTVFTGEHELPVFGEEVDLGETGELPYADRNSDAQANVADVQGDTSDLPDDTDHEMSDASDDGEAKDDVADTENAENKDTPDETDSSEQKELTPEEINEKQKAAIKEGIIKLLKGELNKDEKGNLAEMMMDQYYISQGYTPLHERVTSLDQKGHKGIDGIYEKEGSDGKKQYVIADAKYGQSPLGDTKDGTKQMSKDWIDDRLDDSVGKEKADEIREAGNDGRVETSVFHVNISGNGDGLPGEIKCETQSVDETGSKVPGTKQEVETYDANGDVKEEQS